MYQSSNRSILWFCVAMSVALLLYAVARNQLWVANTECPTLEAAYDL